MVGKTILGTAVDRCQAVSQWSPNMDSRLRDGIAAAATGTDGAPVAAVGATRGARRNHRRNRPRVTRYPPATSATGSHTQNPRTRTDRSSQ